MNWRRHQRGVTRVWLAAGLACVLPAAMAGGRAWPAVSATVPAPAASVSVIIAAPGITLEQAVAKVQQKTHGKVLRASTRQYGNATEYRIKVLTPDGHVRVIPVRSGPTHDQPQSKAEETH